MMRYVLVALFLISGFLHAQQQRTLEDLKKLDGFMKVVPKGKIAAIRQPKFVVGKDADMPADAWVIGVAFNGKAKAYSINLLNRHEIVNDFIAGKPIATTW